MDPYRAVQRTSRTPFWHGGFSGLSVGDELLSRQELRDQGRPAITNNNDDDPSVVYITDDLQVARSFAAMRSGSSSDVYEVRPMPPSSLAIDTDFPKTALTCKRARIVGVHERNVRMTFEEAAQIIAPHLAWQDDTPIYTADGLISLDLS